MAYKTRLDPPPANGWVPPPLPPLEELIPDIGAHSGKTAPKRRERKSAVETSEVAETRATYGGFGGTSQPMANLFEPVPRSLFDDVEEEVEETAASPAPPEPQGPIVINGQPAQLVEVKRLDATRTQYRVILDETGELKSFVSPPAVVTP